MPQPIASDRRLTVEEFATHPSDERAELVHGEVRLSPQPASRHGRVIGNVTVLLSVHAHPRKLGAVFADGTGFELPKLEATVRGPDVSFVHRDQLPKEGVGLGWLNVAPDLVVEVLSPSERASAVEEKIADYLRAGTRLMWVIDPDTRQVSIYSSSGPARWLSEGDTIDGGDVLPDFSCRVAEFFEGLARTGE
jgi:Uma2 family endonuclease